MTQRLSAASAAFLAAQAEFTAAFKAEGFEINRAERAQARLEAAKAELQSAIAGEAGEVSRERALANIEHKLGGAQRGLRAVEWKLRDACRAANVDVRGLATQDVARKIEGLRETSRAALAKRDLKPARRVTLERQDQLLAEAEYRLEQVKRQAEEVGRLQADIAALKPRALAAK